MFDANRFKPRSHLASTVECEELATLEFGALGTAVPNILSWCMSKTLKIMVIKAWLRKTLARIAI